MKNVDRRLNGSNEKYFRLVHIDTSFLNDNNNSCGYVFECFKLPDGMKKEQAFLVISHLMETVEQGLGFEPGDFSAVVGVDLLLESYGFNRDCYFEEARSSADLCTVVGKKINNFPSIASNWFTSGVTEDDVLEIYDRCGVSYPQKGIVRSRVNKNTF